MSDQKKSEFQISLNYPKQYTKNLAYLAIKSGASRIIDTDDDNFPDISEWENLLKSEFKIFDMHPLKRYYLKIFIHFYTYIPFRQDSLILLILMSLTHAMIIERHAKKMLSWMHGSW